MNPTSKKEFSTKLQFLHRLQEGVSFGDGGYYKPQHYSKMASEFSKKYKTKNYPQHENVRAKQQGSAVPCGYPQPQEGVDPKSLLFSPENLEKDYWNIVENRNEELNTEYGNDVDSDEFGSGFPLSERGRSVNGTIDIDKVDLPEPEYGTEEYYKETYWNLNNLPNAPESVLRHVKVGINGINVPWMYYGSLFATFCWHNEDNYLYSVNYHHTGAPKQWYGVPGAEKAAEGLEKIFKNYLSLKMRDVPDLLHHITTMFSPRLLQHDDVPVYKLIQYPGEYVVTFPRAFHGGFSLGSNIGEACNFATHDWISFGADANERYRSFARPAVFSHDRLTFTMAYHLEEQQTYASCKLLLDELKRVVEEELELREKLTNSGVRDLAPQISLPPNRLDQLDEQSANYDDQRLCHACKHVCFFSGVACACSHTKISCLRHSHFMCRCPTSKRYLMIWSKKDELQETLKKVEDHCESLKTEAALQAEVDEAAANLAPLPPVAPGVEQDLENHKDEEIDLEPYCIYKHLGWMNQRRRVDEGQTKSRELEASRVAQETAEFSPPPVAESTAPSVPAQ